MSMEAESLWTGADRTLLEQRDMALVRTAEERSRPSAVQAMEIPLPVVANDPQDVERVEREQRDHEPAGQAERRLRQTQWRRVDLWIAREILKPGKLREDLLSLFGHVMEFLLAHGLGYVGEHAYRRYYTHCCGCTFKVSKKLGSGPVEFCRGENGGRGCACPQNKWWRPNWLHYRLHLGAFACPIGKFSMRWSWSAVVVWLVLGLVGYGVYWTVRLALGWLI